MLVDLHTREAEIAKLNLPPNVLKITRGNVPHEILSDDCRDPIHAYEWDSSPDGIEVVPLWTGHSSVTGFIKTSGGVEYLRYDIEYPNDYEILGTSIFSVITDLMIWYWRESEISDDTLRDLASTLDYPSIDRFLREIKMTQGEPREVRESWETSFKRSI